MRLSLVVPSLAVLAITAPAQTASPTADPNVHVVEEIAAKVNGKIVTRGQLDEKYKELEAGLVAQGLKGKQLADALTAAKADALEGEIDTLLLVQKGEEMPGVSVDTEVTKYLNNLRAQFKFADEDKFHNWIQEQSGMSFEEFRENKRKEFLANKVVGYEVASRVAVPEADLQKYYDEHKAQYMRDEEVFLSQILISTEGKSPDQLKAAEDKANSLADRARKGEKFSDLARENSDDPETAQNGGYLGSPSKRGTLRPEIEEVVFKQKKGYVTNPIRLTSPPGFLILKVEEHYEAGQASFDEVKEEVQNAVVSPIMGPKVREYLTQLRREAFLQIKDGYVDTGAAPGQDTRWKDVALLKAPLTTKEEVLASSKSHKKVLGVPIPGTEAPAKTVEETEKAPKTSKRRAADLTPEAIESGQGPKAPKEDTSPPMAPIKQ